MDYNDEQILHEEEYQKLECEYISEQITRESNTLVTQSNTVFTPSKEERVFLSRRLFLLNQLKLLTYQRSRQRSIINIINATKKYAEHPERVTNMSFFSLSRLRRAIIENEKEILNNYSKKNSQDLDYIKTIIDTLSVSL